MHQLALVHEFMSTMGQATPATPTMLNKKERRFRWSLTREENRELRDAEFLVEYLDAVVDKLYVTLGDAVAAGFDVGTLSQAFHEVHRSNMSKLWSDGEVAAGLPEDCTAKPSNVAGLQIVTRKDGKVIKSPSYSPANLAQFIKES